MQYLIIWSPCTSKMEAVIDLQVNTTEEKQGTKQSKEETKDDAKDTDIKVQDG